MQTIKRAAVIFLVLTLVLSCFSPVIAVSAETGPASTSPAATPNASGGETSETTAAGTTPTTAVTEETESPQAPQETTPVIEATAPVVTTVPTETTAPEENTEVTNVTEVTEATQSETNTLTGHLDSKDADISVLLLDQMVAEGIVLNVQEATLDNETMKTVMSKLNLLVLLGVLQNDPYYIYNNGGEDLTLANIPQKQLSHNYMTANAKVDGNAITMTADNGSNNAKAPLTIVNARGFDLPQTGDTGTWLYSVIGIVLMAGAAAAIVIVSKKKSA